MGISAENLGASPLKKNLPNDTTFSQTNLAGQSLQVQKIRWDKGFKATCEELSDQMLSVKRRKLIGPR
jgi:hypothetical protein